MFVRRLVKSAVRNRIERYHVNRDTHKIPTCYNTLQVKYSFPYPSATKLCIVYKLSACEWLICDF